MSADPRTPDWVKDAIFYQIFPDRFATSSLLDKPHNLEPWDVAPTTNGFKGGDLLGVVEHLDYLEELGVNAIYLNPIFQSTANHRYHTHDYFHVDPILGGDDALHRLLDDAHARGMRVVLDGVFNHASRGLYQFNHALENGAASPYLDWFDIRAFPVHAYDGKPNYACWFNLAALPKLNYKNPQVRSFAFAIAEHWVRAGIDGWRLDVPEEIDDDDFWREFRTRVKRINPDAYLVGEIWHRADRWLAGDQFDGVMNYQLTRACLSFFVDHDAASLALTNPRSYGPIRPINAIQFRSQLDELLSWYSPQVDLAQLNLLDSHDTARFLTIAGRDVPVLKLAYLLLFTFPGPPMIYYGDEIGLEGGHDPDCRRGMIWEPEKWNGELLRHMQWLAGIRKQHPALRRGAFKSLFAKDRIFAFARRDGTDGIVVALNAGHSAAVFDLPLQAGMRLVADPGGQAIDARDGIVHGIHIGPREGLVWTALPL